MITGAAAHSGPGFYYQPLAGCLQSDEIVLREVFGPVVTRFEHGAGGRVGQRLGIRLASSVWTQNIRSGAAHCRPSAVRQHWINTHFTWRADAHGGLKRSGYEDLSSDSLQDYSVVRHVMAKFKAASSGSIKKSGGSRSHRTQIRKHRGNYDEKTTAVTTTVSALCLTVLCGSAQATDSAAVAGQRRRPSGYHRWPGYIERGQSDKTTTGSPSLKSKPAAR